MRVRLPRYDGRIASTRPTLFSIEPDTNRGATEPSEKCRSVAVCQIHHQIKPSTASRSREPPLIEDRSSIQRHDVVHIWVPDQNLVRPPIDEDGHACGWIGGLQRVQRWSRQEHVAKVTQLNN